jgi:cytochrome P450
MARVVKPVEIHGFQVPPGWLATGVIYSSMHNERVYADAERFDPDRFAPQRAEDKKAENAFVAQGGGPPEGHRCLGESVSAIVMKLFLARLLRDYTWELLEQPQGLPGRPGQPAARPVQAVGAILRRVAASRPYGPLAAMTPLIIMPMAQPNFVSPLALGV